MIKPAAILPVFAIVLLTFSLLATASYAQELVELYLPDSNKIMVLSMMCLAKKV